MFVGLSAWWFGCLLACSVCWLGLCVYLLRFLACFLSVCVFACWFVSRRLGAIRMRVVASGPGDILSRFGEAHDGRYGGGSLFGCSSEQGKIFETPEPMSSEGGGGIHII